MPGNGFKKSTLTLWLVITLSVLMLMAGEAVALHRYALVAPGTADFFARWYGGKELVLRGRNPYNREIDLEAQLAMFGRYTRPDEDQVNFAYPLYTVYFFWPLTFVPYPWAQAIWMVTLQFALIALTLVSLSLVRWRPPPWLFAVTIFWSVFFYPGARAIMLGQFSILVALAVTIALWGLATGRDRPAGVVLALATIKPQMVFLIIPLLLLWAFRQKRWSFIIAFALSGVLLLFSSIAWVPDWPARFINNLSAYSGYVGFGSPLENLTARFAPGPASWLNPAVTIALTALLLRQWWKLLTVHPEDLLWTATLTLLIGNLVALRSATTNHVILYPALLLVFKRLHLSRTLKGSGGWVAVLQAAVTVGLWVLFLTTIDTTRGDNFEAVFLHGLLPALLLIVYLIDRKRLKAVTPTVAHRL